MDIYDIPIAAVTEQYMSYVSLLQNLDPNLASEFLVMAATLMEIKSRTLLPRPPVEEGEEEDFADPRLELVKQLLEYKKYKDAAGALDEAKSLQELKHKRMPVIPRMDNGELDLEEVQVWDLFEAFQQILTAIGKRNYKHEVLYDDTPIALHAADILDIMQRHEGRQRFQSLFEGRSKSQLIGLFLAVLELIRQKRIRAIQEGEFAPIELDLLDPSPVDVDEETDYGFGDEEPDAELAEPSSCDQVLSYPLEGEDLHGSVAVGMTEPVDDCDAGAEPMEEEDME